MRTSDRPELPDGWHYTDDLVWDDPRPVHRGRTLAVVVTAAVVLAAALAALVVWNADRHYARGVAALNAHSYAVAARELSAARLIVLPYRDAQSRADYAQSELVAEAAGQKEELAREDLVNGALQQAAAAFEHGDAEAVGAALLPLPASVLRAVLRASPVVRASAATLADRIATAASEALRRGAWGRAGRFAEALLVLRPADEATTALEAKARTGVKLSAKLAEAHDDAIHGHWRSALRLALAVTAVEKDFPGVSGLIARARVALAPKPKPKSTSTAPTSTATTTTTAPSTGGTSSGSSSQPPPP